MQCGLLGAKLAHSYSPQIHQSLGNYSYRLFEVEEAHIAQFLNNTDFRGLNVTIPYKKTVIPFCQQLSPQAQKIGAVNTIVRRDDGTLIGHNTDYFGFMSMAQKSGLSFTGKKVLVLGSGGASNTVCTVLKELQANYVVISRNGENSYNHLHLHQDCAIIVNATPVGMYPNTGISPIDLSLFPKLEGVLDLIYNPAKTKLLQDAESRHLTAMNGLWMLVAQAKESAQWFTGCKIDNSHIERIYCALQTQMRNIVLVGMPGCGKSTIGHALGKALNRPFVDADDEIVKTAGISIPEIFVQSGEAGFRAIETQVLQQITAKSGTVIATGGGCVTRSENIPLLRQNSIVIWIQRPLEALPVDGRPLSQANMLGLLYEKRRPLYETASDWAIENKDSIEDAVDKILVKLTGEHP